uniref:JHL23J11.8 protein n=1 Tax=Rhizophora mucronata TaxID=61149 RepID=A0A2P2K374_RHIMU
MFNYRFRTDREAKRKEKMLLMQMEKSKREFEREKKRAELQIQKENRQTEKEQRRLQEEAEKDERCRQKHESEMQKQLRKQHEDVEKEQRRREKEEAELKRQLSIQKQASMMERFLKRSNTSLSCQNDQSSSKKSMPSSSSKEVEKMPDALTLLMDCALLSNDQFILGNIRKSHLSSWHRLGHSVRVNTGQHWSIRRKPKTELFKELKLSAFKELAHNDKLSAEKLLTGWGELTSDDRSSFTKLDYSSHGIRRFNHRKKLLQFDKSHRPAFYGIWPKQSQAVGPRHPFRKELELDYDADSDEEWEEEDPGESLSDCDKDDGEESLEELSSKADDEEESEDGFFVPDGYLSENEGVQIDRIETVLSVNSAGSSSGCKQDMESEQFHALLQQQKYLSNLTESALRKNQPLIILNMMHEKVPLLAAEDLSGASKVEKLYLQALSMRAVPGAPHTEITVDSMQDDAQDVSLSFSKIDSTPSTEIAIPESDVPIIVSTIQSCSQSINKVVESLQQKFPTIPKFHLKNKVREISDFVDNHWQVKKNVLEKVGMSKSPEKCGGRMQNISAFFSKRCLPPPAGAAGKSINNPNDNETSPSLQISPKIGSGSV